MAVPSADNVQVITLSEEERKRGKYSPKTLVNVLNAMHQDGLVVLKNVIPVEFIDKLNAKMCDEADKKLADPSLAYNHGRPPITDPEYLSDDLYFNSFLLQLVNAYLGPKPVWNWLTANNALANTKGMRQPAHKDSSFDHPQFPYCVIANVPLCDFSIENGATEFWLGSHAQATAAEQVLATSEADVEAYPRSRIGGAIPPISEAAKEQRMKIRPPIQPTCCKGDIMIRDLRTWHAGMPNSTNAHRIMLGLGYISPYHPNYLMRVHLPFSQREFFMSHADTVDVRAQWYDEQEYEKTTADMFFDMRPVYLEE